MAIPLEEIFIDFGANFSKLDATLDAAVARSKVAAQKIDAAMGRPLTAKVDDRQLTALNAHLDLKKKHYAEVQNFINTHPITPKFDDHEVRSAYESVKRLQSLGGSSTIHVKMTSESRGGRDNRQQHSVDHRAVAKGVKDGIKDSADVLTKVIKDAGSKGVVGTAVSAVAAPFKMVGSLASNILSGLSMGVLLPIGQQIGDGLADGIEDALGETLGSFGLLGRKGGAALTKGIADLLRQEAPGTFGPLFDALEADISEFLGKQDVQVAAAAKRMRDRQKQTKQKGEALEQVTYERKQTIRDLPNFREQQAKVQAREKIIQERGKALQLEFDAFNAEQSQGLDAKSVAQKLNTQRKRQIDLTNSLLKAIPKTGDIDTSKLEEIYTKFNRPEDEQKIKEIYLRLLSDRKNPEYGYRDAIESGLNQLKQDIKPEELSPIEIKSFSSNYFKTLREELQKQQKQLQEDIKELTLIQQDLVKFGQRAMQQKEFARSLRPNSSLPASYESILQQVAALSGVQFSEEQAPKLVPSAALGAGEARYQAEGNQIVLSKDTFEALQRGTLTEQMVKTLAHEIRHGFQMGFGSVEGVNAGFQGKSLIDLLKPTYAEAASLGGRIEASARGGVGGTMESRRRIEADAYVFEERFGSEIFAQMNRDIGMVQKQQIGNIVADIKEGNALVEEFKTFLKEIKSTSEKMGINIKSDFLEALDTVSSVQSEIKSIIAAARNAEFLPIQDIDELQNTIANKIAGFKNSLDAQRSKLTSATTPTSIVPANQQSGEFNTGIDLAKDIIVSGGQRIGHALEQTAVMLEKYTLSLAGPFGFMAKDMMRTAAPVFGKVARHTALPAALMMGAASQIPGVGPMMHGAGQMLSAGISPITGAIGQHISSSMIAQIQHFIPKTVGLGQFGIELPFREQILEYGARQTEAVIQNVTQFINQITGQSGAAIGGGELLMAGGAKAAKAVQEATEGKFTSAVNFVTQKVEETVQDFSKVVQNSANEKVRAVGESIANQVNKASKAVRDNANTISVSASVIDDPWDEPMAIPELPAATQQIQQESYSPGEVKDYVQYILDQFRKSRESIVDAANAGNLEMAQGIAREMMDASERAKAEIDEVYQSLKTQFSTGDLQTAGVTAVVAEAKSAITKFQKTAAKYAVDGLEDQLNSPRVLQSIGNFLASDIANTALRSGIGAGMAAAGMMPTAFNRENPATNAAQTIASLLDTTGSNATGGADQLIAEHAIILKQIFIDPLLRGEATIEETFSALRAALSQNSGDELGDQLEAQRVSFSGVADDIAYFYLKVLQKLKQIPDLSPELQNKFNELETEIGSGNAPQAKYQVSDVNEKIYNAEEVARKVQQNIDKFNQVEQRVDEGGTKRNLGNFFEELGQKADKAGFPLKRIGQIALDTAQNLFAMVGAFSIGDMIAQIGIQSAQTAIKMTQLQLALNFSTGGKGEQTLDKLRDKADKLGTSLLSVAEGYKIISAATFGTSLQGQTEKIVSGFVERAAAQGSSGEQTQAALTQVAQSIGKTKVQMEELVIIAENMPGVMQSLGRALGMTTQEMYAQSAAGNLLADQVFPKLAQQLSLESAAGLVEFADSPIASINRLNNTITNLQASIGAVTLETIKPGADAAVTALKILADNGDKVAMVLQVAFFTAVGVGTKALWGFMLTALQVPMVLTPMNQALYISRMALTTLAPLALKAIAAMAVPAAIVMTWKLVNDNIKANAQSLDSLTNANKRLRQAEEARMQAEENRRRQAQGKPVQPGIIEGSSDHAQFWDPLLRKANEYREQINGIAGILSPIAGAGLPFLPKFQSFGEKEAFNISNDANEQIIRSHNTLMRSYKQLADVGNMDVQIKALQDYDNQIAITTANLNSAKLAGNLKEVERLQKVIAELQTNRQPLFEKLFGTLPELEQIRNELKKSIEDLEQRAKDNPSQAAIINEVLPEMKNQLRLTEAGIDRMNQAMRQGKGAAIDFAIALGKINAQLEDMNFADTLKFERQRTAIMERQSKGLLGQTEAQKLLAEAENSNYRDRLNRLEEFTQKRKSLYDQLSAQDRAALDQVIANQGAQGPAALEFLAENKDKLGLNEAQAAVLRAQAQIQRQQEETEKARQGIANNNIQLRDLAKEQNTAAREMVEAYRDLMKELKDQLQEARYNLQEQLAQLNGDKLNLSIAEVIAPGTGGYMREFIESLGNFGKNFQSLSQMVLDIQRKSTAEANRFRDQNQRILDGRRQNLETQQRFNNTGIGLPSVPETAPTFAQGAQNLANAPMTSPFGMRNHPVLGGMRMHTGMDFGLNANTPLSLKEQGQITRTGFEEGYGNWVELQLMNGTKLFFAHLNKVLVQAGQKIDPNQVFALSGNTGRGTGAHLHLEAGPEGKEINPAPFVGLIQFGGNMLPGAMPQIAMPQVPAVAPKPAGPIMPPTAGVFIPDKNGKNALLPALTTALDRYIPKPPVVNNAVPFTRPTNPPNISGGAFTPPGNLRGLQGINNSLMQDAPSAFNLNSPQGRARLAIALGIAGTESTDWLRGNISPAQTYNMMGGALKNGKPNMRGPFQFNQSYWAAQTGTRQGQNQLLGQMLSGQLATPDSKQQKDFGAELTNLMASRVISTPEQLKQWMSTTLGYAGGGRNWQGLSDGWGRTGGLENKLFEFLSQGIPARQAPAAGTAPSAPTTAAPAVGTLTNPAVEMPNVMEETTRQLQANRELNQVNLEGIQIMRERYTVLGQLANVQGEDILETAARKANDQMLELRNSTRGVLDSFDDLANQSTIPSFDRLTEQRNREITNSFLSMKQQMEKQAREINDNIKNAMKLLSGANDNKLLQDLNNAGVPRAKAEEVLAGMKEKAKKDLPALIEMLGQIEDKYNQLEEAKNRAFDFSKAKADAEALSGHMSRMADLRARNFDLQASLAGDPMREAALRGKGDKIRLDESFRQEIMTMSESLQQMPGLSEAAVASLQNLRMAAMQANVSPDALMEAIRALPADAQRASEALMLAAQNYQLGLQQIAEQSNWLKQQIQSGLSSAFETLFQDLTNGTKTLGQAFQDFGRNVLQMIAKILLQLAAMRIAKAITGGLFGGAGGGGGLLGGLFRFADGGEVPHFDKGGPVIDVPYQVMEVQHLANGGMAESLGFAVMAAMQKEGANAVPAVLHTGEQVLTDKNGDAQFYRALEKSGRWMELKKSGVQNYDQGGIVGSAMARQSGGGGSSGGRGRGSTSVTVNNQNTYVVSDVNDLRRSEKQRQRDSAENTRRAFERFR